MEVIFKLEKEFGNERFYPVNDTAKGLLEIMPRRLSFLRSDLVQLDKIGFKVRIEQDTVIL